MLNRNAQKLVDALRSRRFTQGTDRLTTILDDGTERDCCLGVACKLYIEDGNVLVVGCDNISQMTRTYNGQRSYLPEEVREWLNFSSNEGAFRDDEDFTATLADLNDDRRTFEEIADVIESEPKGLFLPE